MKAFSRDVIHLPPPSPEPDSNSVAALSNSADGHSRCFAVTNGSNSFAAYIRSLTNSVDACKRSLSLPVINGSGQMLCIVHSPQCAMSFHKVVLSSSPDSSSMCVVAAPSTMNACAMDAWDVVVVCVPWRLHHWVQRYCLLPGEALHVQQARF